MCGTSGIDPAVDDQSPLFSILFSESTYHFGEEESSSATWSRDHLVHSLKNEPRPVADDGQAEY
jgi:hypothetical protein